MTLARFRRKLRAFELYLAEGRFARDWGRDSFEVLVMTCSAGRLRHLCEAAQAEVPEDRWDDYSFATFDVLDPATFGESAWTTLWGDEVGLLYSCAYPPDPDEVPETSGDAERNGLGRGDSAIAMSGPTPSEDRHGADGR